MNKKEVEEEEKRYLELQLLALDFARQGETKDLTKMIDHGMPVNLADEKGNTLLMLASYYDQVDTVKMLLTKNADLNRKNMRGQTPVSGAIFKGYFEVVKILVEAGCEIESVIGEKTNALQVATIFGHTHMVDYLYSKNSKKKFWGVGAKKWVLITSTLRKFFDIFRKNKI